MKISNYELIEIANQTIDDVILNVIQRTFVIHEMFMFNVRDSIARDKRKENKFTDNNMLHDIYYTLFTFM